eukprot:m.21152 g.21152  ORF g.21152 m.21152 type:complete len:61 (+) comp12638_c0_seq2:87-269(+)
MIFRAKAYTTFMCSIQTLTFFRNGACITSTTSSMVLRHVIIALTAATNRTGIAGVITTGV